VAAGQGHAPGRDARAVQRLARPLLGHPARGVRRRQDGRLGRGQGNRPDDGGTWPGPTSRSTTPSRTPRGAHSN